MNTESIIQEIKTMFSLMGFGEELEDVDAREGAISRFSVRVSDVPLRDVGRVIDDAEGFSSGQVFTSNLIIGERGTTLAALEHILKKIIKKKYGEDFKFTLDINDYRMKRLDDLKQDIKAAAKEVRMYKKEAPLRPMSSFERRIVHLVLAEYPDITTESIGQEPNRRVVIKPFP